MAINSYQGPSHSKLGGNALQHGDSAFVANANAGDAAGDVITQDAIVHCIVIVNESGVLTHVTVVDRQAGAKAFAFGKSSALGQGGALVFESEIGLPATGGLNITADQTNALSVKVVWRKP